MHKKSAGVPTPKISRTSDGRPALKKQKHGGALLTGGQTKAQGGKAGSGRLANDELAWLRKIVTGPRARRSLRKIMRAGRDGDKLALIKLGMDRVFGAPNQKIASTITLADLLEEEET